MSFFSSLAQSFSGSFGKSEEGGPQQLLKSILNKLVFWIIVTFFFFILYCILYLAQCSKPEGGSGVCLINENNGSAKTFTYDISNLSTGGECGVGDPYEMTGQQVDWIDTGFETTGQQLIVYAYGNYFPWGEKQTPKTFSYHVSPVKMDDGTVVDALSITTDYKECDLNTNINYSLTDDQDTKVMYENHFNSYTSINANNRNDNKGKAMIDSNIQGDCIIGNNCKIGSSNEIQSACVLKHGAGIYMRIGEDAPFSYHIKNYFVPEYEIKCISGNCKYQYKTSYDGAVYNLIQVPYAMPPVIYKKGANSDGFIWDIRDNVIKNLQILKDYDKETEYKFYTLTPDPENQSCFGDDYQKINGACYHSEQKKMSIAEIQNVNCPIVSKTESINLPDELCAPQSGKRIYVKPADTCYEDDTGQINLTFASGAKDVRESSFSYRSDGLHITLFKNIVATLFEPFFGSQKDDSLESEFSENDITICRQDGNNDDVLYYITNSEGDWVVKTDRYSSPGIKIKDSYNIPTKETLKISYLSPNVKKCVVLKIKENYEASKTISDYVTEDIRENAAVTFVKFSHMKDGLFVQVRNSIMSTYFYHSVRILIVVWFVFSFGLGFINKEKMLSRVPLITSDWKRFLILLWCTDPKNYDFIDAFLWNGLIYVAQSISAGIFSAISDVHGTSLVSDDPMAFFDDVIASITSKEVFYKLGAVATSSSFILFFFLFPFLANGIIDFILAVLGPIVSLGFTMFSFGSIIMFMPLYALISMFGGSEKDKFKVAITTLIKEFIHFAFSVAFFGICIGFIYHYFVEIIDVKVCWLPKKLPIGWPLNTFLFNNHHDWQICAPGSMSAANDIDRTKIVWAMFLSTFKFTMVLSIMGKLSIIISEQLADIFSKGGGSFGIKASSEIFNSFKEIFKKAIGVAGSSAQEKGEEKHANEMSKKRKENDEVYRSGADDVNNDTDSDKDNKANNKEKNTDDDRKDIKLKDKKHERDKENKNEENEENENEENEKNSINKDKFSASDEGQNLSFNNNNNLNIPSPGHITSGVQARNYGNKSSKKSLKNNNYDNETDIKANNGAGLQENDLGLKDIHPELRENNAGLQENDFILHNSLAGDRNSNDENQKIIEQFNENEEKKSKFEKSIKKLDKQTDKWDEFSKNLNNKSKVSKNEKEMTDKMLNVLEQKTKIAKGKLKDLENKNSELERKNSALKNSDWTKNKK